MVRVLGTGPGSGHWGCAQRGWGPRVGGEVGTGDKRQGQGRAACFGTGRSPRTYPSRLEGQGTLTAPSRPLPSLCWAEGKLILAASSQESFLELVVFELSFVDGRIWLIQEAKGKGGPGSQGGTRNSPSPTHSA